ncbi:type II toxin-antitoxin system ParD family antitoxin [uncultured Jannaschia sp.]|uniref:ribbon-helix-helix domain-containing protein n=1 Tax=uncultured Jannaschia sp. TaxID=293347 RepID=UPI002630BC3A|nr:type II toxin-antitoxin system ParD family antitoxin [uncultured Jannaschia sp.]
MSVKTSISLTEAQDVFARRLVSQGRYASLSAVLQQGLDLLRQRTEAEEEELAALRGLLAERREGLFVDMAEGRERTKAMMAAKRAAHAR